MTRTGRPPFDDGFTRQTISVRCTQAEHAAVLDGLTARERMEAMLDKIAAQAADDGGRSVYSSRSGDL